ncbi:signal peptidase complex subunit 1-like [Ornithodoros turicata]|uniref:signal peptidase complex subunit 1-like n=1 Tax=Ornithodoros turicata TaxID=34597 RepID=UPI003139B584
MIEIPFLKSLPSHMDFEGQRRAEKIFQIVTITFAVIGLIWGYAVQQFSYTVITLGAGFVLSCLLTLPPWPFYRRKPLAWQKVREESASSSKPSSTKKKTK